MNIRELKEKIETNTLTEKFLIFECPDSYFLADQYIKEIAKQRGLEIRYSAGNSIVNNYLTVITIDNLKDDINIFENLIVKCKQMSNKNYNNFVVSLPKLEDWQINNYVQANLPGLSKDDISWLCKYLNYDIYSIENEIKKLKVFNEDSIGTIFNQLKSGGYFHSNNGNQTYELADALLVHDVKRIDACLPFNENVMGLAKILTDNTRAILAIQSNSGQTPAQLGISDKQYRMIASYKVGYYETNKLQNIYKKLYNITDRLKSGLLETDKVLDYILLAMV